MILESIVTSVDSQGIVNIAPMGPIIDWDLAGTDPIDKTMVLRPFKSSRTYHNLRQTKAGVVHVTDDTELFARAAVDAIDPNDTGQWIKPLEATGWWILQDCHRYFAFVVESIDDREARTEMIARIQRSEVVRPFFGFNRAKHAVIETAILATRTHLLEEDAIRRQLDQLQPLVDKTGGPAEIAAFDFLKQTIDGRYSSR